MSNLVEKLKQIQEGWGNHLLPAKDKKELIISTSNARLAICETCENYSINGIYKHCSKCGCAFPAKAKCLSCACPIDKWEAILTKEEENKIKEEIK